MEKMYQTIDSNLPKGFENTLSYGMPGWVVPLSYFADGYQYKKDIPLPFISIASQKNFIALYHMGIYADTNFLDWFVSEFLKHSSKNWTWVKAVSVSKK